MGRIDPEKMYENIQKWDWRNINDGKIYLDEQTKRNSISMRNSLFRLSDAFAQKGDTIKAIEVLDLSLEKMPIKDFDHYTLSTGYPEAYYKLGNQEKARETAETLLRVYTEKATWLSTFDIDDLPLIEDELQTSFYIFDTIVRNIELYDNNKDYLQQKKQSVNEIFRLFSHLMPDEE